jgi:hypothetical protein
MIKFISIMALSLSITGCTSNGQSKAEQGSEEDSVALAADSELVRNFFYADGELTWNEISKMEHFEKIRFYLSLTDSISDLWRFKDVNALSYAIVDSTPPLPEDEIIHLHYKQKVKGYKVSVDFVQSYSDLNFGKSILRFTKPNHSFQVYCDVFSDEQLIADDTPYVKSQKTINLAKLKPGANIYLNYVKPKSGEYLSTSSPFYFKDMDFDGEEELVINNLEMGSRGYNTYDIFKVLWVNSPLKLMGLPFNNGEYKITNYNVEYEPKTLSILDKRYDGFTAYGLYRYKSIPANGKNGLSRVFILEEAEDMGFYHPKDKQASDSVNLIQPYKKYKRADGKLVIVEKGVYESGNYGQNYNEVVLERINFSSKGK